MGKIHTTSTVGMSREEWLEIRRKSIGGSDASAIVGLNRYATPYSVWAEKKGLTPDKEETEPMRLGRDLEAYVAERFCEATGFSVRRKNAIIYNDEHPYAHANVDRVVVGDDVPALLECKTTSVLNMSRFKDTDFPIDYYAQCVHYLMVTGYKRIHLAVLVLGRGFFTYTLDRDEEEIKALADAERNFYENYLLTGDAPPIDGLEPTTDAISARYSAENEEEGVTLPLDAYDALLDEFEALTASIDEMETRKAEITNQIKDYMQTSGRAESTKWRVSWSTQTRTTLDKAKLKAALPDIDLSRFEKVSKARPFKVTKIAQNL